MGFDEKMGGETPPLHKGWYVPRGLPHLDAVETMQAITFRLADALPRDVLLARKDEGDNAHRRRIEALLDAGAGSCLLRDPVLAAIVEEALLRGSGTHYDLHAWAVMPNHVHVLMSPFDDRRLPDIVHSWKSSTAKLINKRCSRSGQLWQREYYDRYMRSERHMHATIYYIEQNPVTARLVGKAEDWRFGSAWRKAQS